MRTWCVAAVDAELGNLHADVPTFALGVGMLAAGVRMAELIAEARARDALPARVLVMGTAGAYPDGDGRPHLAIGTVVTASTTGLGSATAASGRGYVPLPPAPVTLTPMADLTPVRVACCTAITTDAPSARALGATWQVEHMELFGVAHACARVGIPVTALLGITNVVGPEAHAQWKANRATVEAATREAARSWLARTA